MSLLKNVKEKNFFKYEKELREMLDAKKAARYEDLKKEYAKSIFEDVEAEVETVGGQGGYDFDEDDMLTAEDIDELDADLGTDFDEDFDESVEDGDEELQEEAFKDLVDLASKKKSGSVKFLNGQETDVSREDAIVIINYYTKLKDKETQKKYEKMLSKDAKSFMMALNLALK